MRKKPKINNVPFLLDRLIANASDTVTREHAEKLLRRMKLPMEKVLAKVPGDSVIAKAKTLGVTRQAVYGWMYGMARPKAKHAVKLARLTGYGVDDIRGRDAA